MDGGELTAGGGITYRAWAEIVTEVAERWRLRKLLALRHRTGSAPASWLCCALLARSTVRAHAIGLCRLGVVTSAATFRSRLRNHRRPGRRRVAGADAARRG